MPLYRAFSRLISSNVPLQGLQEVFTSAEPVLRIEIMLPSSERRMLQYSDPDSMLERDTPQERPEISLNASQLGEVRFFESKRTILFAPSGGLVPLAITHAVCNYVLPRILSHRGELVLHASAVIVDDRVVAFLGASGAGKSTTAAEFVRLGFRHHSDDGLLVRCKENAVSCAPGCSGIWVRPDNDWLLRYKKTEQCPQSDGRFRKHLIEVSDSTRQPCWTTVNAFYLLPGTRSSSAGACSCERLLPSAAFFEILQHTFAADERVRSAREKTHSLIARVVESGTSVKRLAFREMRPDLDHVVAAILNDLRARASADRGFDAR